MAVPEGHRVSKGCPQGRRAWALALPRMPEASMARVLAWGLWAEARGAGDAILIRGKRRIKTKAERQRGWAGGRGWRSKGARGAVCRRIDIAHSFINWRLAFRMR